MKEEKIKKIGTILVLIVLFIMLILAITSIGVNILYKFDVKNSMITILAGKQNKDVTVDINWKEKYPVENEREENKNKIEVFKEMISKIEKGMENKTSQDMIMAERFVEKSYFYDKIIGYTLVSNSSTYSRIKIGDYWCRQAILESDSITDLEQKIQNIKEFNQYLEDRDIDYVYIEAPSKIR